MFEIREGAHEMKSAPDVPMTCTLADETLTCEYGDDPTYVFVRD